MQKVVVSVVVPIWGVEKYIEKCARSLFESTLNNIEFIFIDDCTPDNSMIVLDKVVKEYHNRIVEKNWVIKLGKMMVNSGLPAVRRKGVELSTGDYIIHCDSDDSVDKEMYAKLYEKALAGGFDLVLCDLLLYDDKNRTLWQTECDECISSEQLRQDLIGRKISNSLCTKLVKRDLYDIYHPYYPLYSMDEDNVLACQLAYYAKSLGYIHEPLYFVYANPTSITRQKNQEKIISNIKGQIENDKWIIGFLESKGKEKWINNAINKYKEAINLLHLQLPKSYSNGIYKEVNRLILFSNKYSFRYKIRYFIYVYLTSLHSIICDFLPAIKK